MSNDVRFTINSVFSGAERSRAELTVSVLEPGLYQVFGMDRTVKKLKDKFLHTSTVDDVHVICSLLEYFFRNLKEPPLTFRLSQAFMEAAGVDLDIAGGSDSVCPAFGSSPCINRNTRSLRFGRKCSSSSTAFSRQLNFFASPQGIQKALPVTNM
ncbi:hypothetical protein AAFF_G00095700 [Aldrovandia affinis]|uniref:Rho-GAP domain-containing protein n=1 Tax=Aldrovandia affinis TaxID=143900 RepID=A0AAD7RVH0_9TELE|nr:hypothetical protein AAFF_G00095700 [Aldrovandia affinis]